MRDPQKELEKAENFLQHFHDAEEMRLWIELFFGIKLPMGHIMPDSNSSPIEWMWEAYNTYKLNKGNEVPGFIVLSSRDSYKTLTESMFAVIAMVHFNATIAHLAAVESQASKAIQYIGQFLKKIQPYLAHHNLILDSQNKRKVAIDNDGRIAYVNVIVATLQGTNSEHTNIMTIDEIDVMRFPQAYEEARYIPGVMNGQFPIRIKTSTRKFAFGLMEKELNNATKTREKVLRWNILDITEYCPTSRHRPDEPKQIRYIHPDLPLRNLSEDEYKSLTDTEKAQFEKIEAYSGCAKCKLLPVCQTRLAHRPKDDVGGLYKPIDFTIGQFEQTSDDSARAQLLCWKPSQAGLVYPRFLEDYNTGNVYSIRQAYHMLTGVDDVNANLYLLVQFLKSKDVQFYAGVDWGSTHAFAITVSCIINGEWWYIDSYSVKNLELDEMIRLAESVRDFYWPKKWFADTSQPMFIKEFNTRKMPCAEFKKDVWGGIELVRRQVQDASGIRRLKIIVHERTEFLVDGFKLHGFKLDSAGKPTKDPDDGDYADVMDTVRYQAQNLFHKTGKLSIPKGPNLSPPTPEELERQRLQALNQYQEQVKKQQSEWLNKQINKSTQEAGGTAGVKSSKNKSIFWDID